MFFYSKGNTVYCESVNQCVIQQTSTRGGWCSYWEAAVLPVFKQGLIKNLKPKVNDNMVVCFAGRRS